MAAGGIGLKAVDAVDAVEATIVGTSLPFGYGGYVADPGGHPWEVCYNLSFPIGPDGRIEMA